MAAADRVDPAVRTAAEEDVALRGAPWRRLVVVGDSIAEATLGDPVDGLQSLGWPRRVARALRRHQPALRLVNLGERRLTSALVRERQLAPALAARPDLAVVACGANDVLASSFRPDATQAQIAAIVGALQDAGATVAVMTTFDAAGALRLPPPLRERAELLGAHAGVVRAVAADNGAILVDLFRLARGSDPAIFSADQIHANELGQAIVASEVVGALGEHLARRPPLHGEPFSSSRQERS